jgi:hypothetical protein
MTSTAAPSTSSVPSADPIRLVSPAEHTPLTTQTPGMERREVLARPGVWIGLTRTAPGSTSGWHHHAEMETYIYVQAGTARTARTRASPAPAICCTSPAGRSTARRTRATPRTCS